ncbi:hypothetical protein AKJ16_DCAP26048, partial [Drosera capensis]
GFGPYFEKEKRKKESNISTLNNRTIAPSQSTTQIIYPHRPIYPLLRFPFSLISQKYQNRTYQSRERNSKKSRQLSKASQSQNLFSLSSRNHRQDHQSSDSIRSGSVPTASNPLKYQSTKLWIGSDPIRSNWIE